MHVADGPVGIVRERVDHLDRHHRALEGRHAVEGHGDDHHAQHGVRAQLVPGARKRHQAVDHATPGGHPQHDREDHAQSLRPVRQGGVVQVVRARPDIEEDQRPEVDDRQPVGIDRAIGPLGHEVVHDREEAGGQEEADRVMAVPPLHHRILHARPGAVGLVGEGRDRHRGVVAQMQHRNRDDEGKEEPVRHIDMRPPCAFHSVAMKTRKKVTQTTVRNRSAYHSGSAYSFDWVMPRR